MKKINSDNWAPLNRRARYMWTPYIPITNPPLVRVDNLYYSLYVYNDITGELAMFYYILERVVSYNILDKDNYFYEDD
jgi:hypothetical protein